MSANPKKTPVFLRALLWFSIAGGLSRAEAAQDPALERAMAVEIQRAVSELKAEGYPRPYYVSLTATDIDYWEQKCVLGGVSLSAGYRQRLITPDLRVGDYSFDNHPVSSPLGFLGRSASYEENEFSLRHELWQLLDGAYKNASADFLRKQALRVSRGKTEYDTDDLSRERPRARTLGPPQPSWGPGPLERLCREASAVFTRSPELLRAEVGVRSRRVWSRLRDSEGSRVDFGRDTEEIELEAVDISTDGTKLAALRRFLAPSLKALPPIEELKAEAEGMLTDLEALRIAKSTSPFSAPALIDPSVSAAVVLAIGLRLSGEEQRNPSGAQIFRDKLGREVMPRGFTLEDDPGLEFHGGFPLAGHYDYDDQGVPARRVILVERGVLKGFLLSRYPVIGFARSNGHGRGFPGYPPEGSPGTLILRSERSWSPENLLGLLREECRRRGKPYGFWVRKLRNFTQQQATSGHGAIRLMPGLLYLVEAETGRLTLVRDLDMVGTPLVLMNNILKAGDDAKAHNLMASAPVSVIVPSLLLADVEIQRAETSPENPPILPPPAAPGEGP